MGIPLSSDTDPAAEKFLLDILRHLPPWRKVQLVADANWTARMLCMSGLRQRHPEESDSELCDHYRRLVLGEELALRVASCWKRR